MLQGIAVLKAHAIRRPPRINRQVAADDPGALIRRAAVDVHGIGPRSRQHPDRIITALPRPVTQRNSALLINRDKNLDPVQGPQEGIALRPGERN